MQDGILTIAITSYNYAHYIIDAVESVVNQTSSQWRLVIYDNCSTDNTVDVLKPYLHDERIKLYIHGKNIGGRENSQFAARHADTEFFSILQADDFLENTFVEMALYQYKKYPSAPFVFFNWHQYMDDTKTSFYHGRFPFSAERSGPLLIGPFLSVCNFIPLHMAVFRTKWFQECYDLLIESPLNQVGEQYILKLLEDKYGCGCYTGTLGGVWRRHGQQMTAIQTTSLTATIEEPIERHWYATRAPNPSHVNVFMALVNFISSCAHVDNFVALNWLVNTDGIRYAQSFNIPVEAERDRLQDIFFTIALKFSTYTFITLIEKANLKDRLSLINCPSTYEGLKCKLEIVRKREGEAFLNSKEIQEICDNFFGKETSYSSWAARRFWDNERCSRIKNSTEYLSYFPVLHILLTVGYSTDNQHEQIGQQLAATFSDLTAQAISNCRLTIFSETPPPDSRFSTSAMLEWVQTTSLTNAIAAVVEASSAEWFMCASDGLRISPAFTLLVGLRLIERPKTLLLYTDEDVVDQDGEHVNPKLKPDINLELLRSSPYIGAATLIHKSLMLDPRIAILPPGLSRNYGAALLAIEQGPTAIDHIDEILVHVPENLVDEYAATPLAYLLVQQHMARCGTVAEVRDGPLPGTLFVDYQLPDQPPKISVIIASKRGRLSVTRACLESLFDNTNYPDFEVLIIDQGIDPGLTALLADGLNRYSQLKILRYPDKQSWLASYNSAARQAQGAFLLFLTDDCIALQENWLTRMAAIGVRAEVGVVGCRLVSFDHRIRHAGLILGHGGAVDYIGRDLPLVEPGYMGRTQLTQNFSAVSGDCMLVRKELFFEVGGFDERNFPNLFDDADFCLKVVERGYQVVWTPFVTFAQQNKDELDDKQKAQDQQQDLLSRKAFIKKWRSRLGNDPAYNRHLSLRQREWMIDGDFDVPWHPDLEPLPRIVAQPPDEMGVGQYRMIGPLKELTDSGRICSFLLPALTSDKRFLPYVSELTRAKPTVFFLQNAFSDFHLDDLQHYAELLPDLFRVFGQDDIVFSVPQKSAARKHFGKDTKARVRKAVSLCHRAIVTTEPIAEAMRGMVGDIRVVPNYLERSRWGDLRPPRNERGKPRVGWAGAQQHDGDLEFILPVVEATANEVDWIFMGMCPPKLRYHVAESHPAVAFDDYPAALAKLDLDLAIAPLELNRFNAAKSNLRLLEYGAVGYPVIATDILPYQGAPVTRVPNNPQAWIKAIREHIHELEATRTAGERLRQWVLSGWMLDRHLDEWLRALLPD